MDAIGLKTTQPAYNGNLLRGLLGAVVLAFIVTMLIVASSGRLTVGTPLAGAAPNSAADAYRQFRAEERLVPGDAYAQFRAEERSVPAQADELSVPGQIWPRFRVDGRPFEKATGETKQSYPRMIAK